MSCNIFSPGGHCLSPLNEYDTTSDSLINAYDLIDNTRDNTRDALDADESRPLLTTQQPPL